MKANNLPEYKHNRIEGIFDIYNYHRFPYEPGVSIALNWNQGRNDIDTKYDVLLDQALMQIHPLKFPEMVQEIYGADKALDMAKVLLHAHIDRMFEMERRKKSICGQ